MKVSIDKRKGFTCYNTNKDKKTLHSFYIDIGGTRKFEGNKKNYICSILEQQLRENDKKQKYGKRWFYTFEEAIGLKFFKTKK